MKVMYDTGATPLTRAHETDAGYDLAVLNDTIIRPGRQIVPTGVHIQLNANFEATVRPRSGCSAKGMPDSTGRRFDADVLIGTIDAGYTGDIGIIVKSNESIPFLITKGTRIAQLVVSEVRHPFLEEVDALETTERGDNGFNSTGTA